LWPSLLSGNEKPYHICDWGSCELDTWAPFTRRFCPRHYAADAKERRDTSRARLCFRLTLYGPKHGDGQRWWRHQYNDLAEVMAGAEILGVQPDETDAISWKALLLAKLDPRRRTVVTDAGRTSTEPRGDGHVGQPSKTQQERLQESGSARWRADFPAVPECKRCWSDKEIILRHIGAVSDDRAEHSWMIGDKRMSPVRMSHTPTWSEVWSWVCPSCEPELMSEAWELWELRRRKIKDA
jgi:hypothetical protein